MLLVINQFHEDILEQAASNRASLILKNNLQNMQILQLFTMAIKMEIIYKSYKVSKLWGLGEERPSGLIKRGGEMQVLETQLWN